MFVIALSVVLSIFALAIPLAWQFALPTFSFPSPTGRYQIGTLTYHWVDPSRSEIFGADRNARRALMAQIWYPAKGNARLPLAPYIEDANAVTAAFARIHHKPAFVFRQLKSVTTNAIAAARVADADASYPVLLFLEGATGFRQMNTFEVEELVSHGYVVVAIDQPGTAAHVVFPDGHHIGALPVEQLSALIRPSYMPGAVAPPVNGRPLSGGSIIPYLTRDIVFALDQLAALNRADPNSILTARLDLSRVGAFGISLGGIVVAEACRVEVRLKACLMMDAPMPTNVVRAGLVKPSMWMTRDRNAMRLERQRSGGWSEVDIEAHQNSMRAAFEGLTAPGYFVQISGTFHSNFTDIPLWSPLTSWLGISGPINTRRAHDIINAYGLAFFDRHLKGLPAALLDKPTTTYPEVRFEAHHSKNASR